MTYTPSAPMHRRTISSHASQLLTLNVPKPMQDLTRAKPAFWTTGVRANNWSFHVCKLQYMWHLVLCVIYYFATLQVL